MWGTCLCAQNPPLPTVGGRLLPGRPSLSPPPPPPRTNGGHGEAGDPICAPTAPQTLPVKSASAPRSARCARGLSVRASSLPSSDAPVAARALCRKLHLLEAGDGTRGRPAQSPRHQREQGGCCFRLLSFGVFATKQLGNDTVSREEARGERSRAPRASRSPPGGRQAPWEAPGRGFWVLHASIRTRPEVVLQPGSPE